MMWLRIKSYDEGKVPMKNRFLSIFGLSVFIVMSAIHMTSQVAALPVQYCVQGGTQALTSGLRSTNYQEGIVPSCTITVYLTGTPTLATIYSDSISTPLSNPFTASSTGQFLIFAAVNQGYDVTLSGGIAPNTYLSPITFTGLYPAQQFTSVGSMVYPPSGVPLSTGSAWSPSYIPVIRFR